MSRRVTPAVNDARSWQSQTDQSEQHEVGRHLVSNAFHTRCQCTEQPAIARTEVLERALVERSFYSRYRFCARSLQNGSSPPAPTIG